jgi:hypothetical protein
MVESAIGHAVGGVCPFAVNAGVRVYLDVSLKRCFKINSHIPYYAHEIFNGMSLLKILTSFVVFDYKHSIITSNYGLTTLAERMTTTAKGIGDDVQHQRILSRICCARSAARAFGGRDGQNYPFVAGKETCLSKLNGGRVCTWRLNGNSW